VKYEQNGNIHFPSLMLTGKKRLKACLKRSSEALNSVKNMVKAMQNKR
jgi:hypothetical protein